MYKVTKRDCPMFGIGPYVCEFICDTASDITTLPTSISEGTGGRTAYDNQKCASGSIANVAENGAESKQYILNNQNIWCPYSVASGSSDSVLEEAKAYTDSEIAGLINGAPTTLDTLKEISDAMAENQTVVEALDAAIGTKANKTDIPTELPANGGTADIARQVISTSSKVKLWEDNEGGNLELVALDGVHSMQMDLFNNASFRMYFNGGDGLVFPLEYEFATKKLNINGDSQTVNGHTVNTDVPADAKFTDTIPDLSQYATKAELDTKAEKELYGGTTIDVGRKSGTIVGKYSTAEGYSTTASGDYSHAEGAGTTASDSYSHAEGYLCTASSDDSHAEGNITTASGAHSHSEGDNTIASGVGSHSGGTSSTASGNYSFAHGMYVKSNNSFEVSLGAFNKSSSDTLFSVGDGTSDSERHNAFEITKTGGMLHDKDILTSAHCIQFIPYNMKYYAQNDRILLFANDDTVTRGIYFVNNTSNDIVVCALISASAEGPVVQYGYGTGTYPDIQDIGGDRREWFVGASIPTSPTIYSMTVPSGKLGYYGVYQNSESAYTTVHDIRCPYFNYF